MILLYKPAEECIGYMTQWLINEKLVLFLLLATGFAGQFWCQWKWFWPYASIWCQQREQVRHYDTHDTFNVVPQVEHTSSAVKAGKTWILIRQHDLYLNLCEICIYVFSMHIAWHLLFECIWSNPKPHKN